MVGLVLGTFYSISRGNDSVQDYVMKQIDTGVKYFGGGGVEPQGTEVIAVHETTLEQGASWDTSCYVEEQIVPMENSLCTAWEQIPYNVTVCINETEEFECLEYINQTYYESNCIKSKMIYWNKTRYVNNCNTALYSGVRNVFEDNQWKRIENARSLKGVPDIYLDIDLDKKFNITIGDYNYTHFTDVCFSSSETGNVPLKVFRYNASIDELGVSKNEKINEVDVAIPTLVANQQKCFNFTLQKPIFDYTLEWGWNSTMIKLTTADTENLDDGNFDEDNTLDGSENNMNVDGCYGNGEVAFIKWNLSLLPSGISVDNSSLCFFDRFNFPLTTATIDIWDVVESKNWNESEIDSRCSDGPVCQAIWGNFNIKLGTKEYTGNQYNFQCFHNLQSALTKVLGEDELEVSFVINNTENGSVFYLVNWATKEESNVSRRPHLNITYTFVSPQITLNAPANDSYTEGINHSILNATVTDPNNDTMTVFIYASNESDKLDMASGLVYIEEDVENNSLVTYNFSTMPVHNDSNGLTMLLHLDNRTELGESANEVYDLSVYGRNGTVRGGAVANVSGRFAGAYHFDEGSSQYIDFGDPTDGSLDLGTGDFTIAVWVWADTTSTGDGIFGKGRYVSAIEGYTLRVNHADGTIQWGIGDGNNGVFSDGGINVPTNEWMHIVARRASGTCSLFANGTQPSIDFACNYDADTALPFGVGVHYIRTSFWDGLIDDFAMWNRSLSDAEILSLYQLGEGTYYWKVNATDSTGANNASETRLFHTGYAPPAPVAGNCTPATVNTDWYMNMSLCCNFTTGDYADGIDLGSGEMLTVGDKTQCGVWNFTTNVSVARMNISTGRLWCTTTSCKINVSG
jgi:hypothetical protein